jgi:hypothetical protein
MIKDQVKRIFMILIHKSYLRIFLALNYQKDFKIAKMRVLQIILKYKVIKTIAV